jgi:tetratricopeptide (TPR) repeat protein
MEKMKTALGRSGQPVKRGTMAHDHDVYMLLADSAAQMRNADAIYEYASRLEELAIRDNHRPYLAIAHRAWGVAHLLANELDEAETSLGKALAAFEDLGTCWQIGRTRMVFAELELARFNRSTARDHYLGAIAEFEQSKCGPDLERARKALEAVLDR